jgi:hypothetical protein
MIDPPLPLWSAGGIFFAKKKLAKQAGTDEKLRQANLGLPNSPDWLGICARGEIVARKTEAHYWHEGPQQIPQHRHFRPR